MVDRGREEAQVCRVSGAGNDPAHVRTVDEQVVVGAERGDGVVAAVRNEAVATAGQVEPEVSGERVHVDVGVAENVDAGAFGGEHLGDHPAVAFPAAHGMPEPVVDGDTYPAGRTRRGSGLRGVLRLPRVGGILRRMVGPLLCGGPRGVLRPAGRRGCRRLLCCDRMSGHRRTSQFSSLWRCTFAVRVIARRRAIMVGSRRR